MHQPFGAGLSKSASCSAHDLGFLTFAMRENHESIIVGSKDHSGNFEFCEFDSGDHPCIDFILAGPQR